MVKWILGLLMTSPLWFGVAVYAASEYGGETVVLETFDLHGGALETKLWVVDIHGEPWLRAGRGDSTWVKRIENNPNIRLTRAGVQTLYRALPSERDVDRVNYRMREKYGYADQLISLIHDEAAVVPIRLAPTR